MRESEKAIEHYDAALQVDPTHRSALFRLAYLCERVGEDERALDAYQQLAALLPIDRNVLINIGILYEDMGRDQEAAASSGAISRTHAPGWTCITTRIWSGRKTA